MGFWSNISSKYASDLFCLSQWKKSSLNVTIDRSPNYSTEKKFLFFLLLMSGPRWFWKCDIVSHFTVYPTISISLYVFSVEAVWVTVSPKKSTDPQTMLLYCGKNSRPIYLYPQYSVVGLCKNWAIFEISDVGCTNVLLLRACVFFYLAVCFLNVSQLFETRF